MKIDDGILFYEKQQNPTTITRIRISFKSKNQLPWIMIVREYLDEVTSGLYCVTYATVLWSLG